MTNIWKTFSTTDWSKSLYSITLTSWTSHGTLSFLMTSSLLHMLKMCLLHLILLHLHLHFSPLHLLHHHHHHFMVRMSHLTELRVTSLKRVKWALWLEHTREGIGRCFPHRLWEGLCLIHQQSMYIRREKMVEEDVHEETIHEEEDLHETQTDFYLFVGWEAWWWGIQIDYQVEGCPN